MSALTLHGPRWVTMRQHRAAIKAFAIVVLLAALAVTAFLIVSGIAEPKTDLASQSEGAMTALLKQATTPLTLLPVLVGAFVAGPLVARELESGTYTWLWTQSVSPARWLAAKLAVVTAVVLSGSAVLVVLFRVARSGLSETSLFSLTWYDTAYEMLGPVAVVQCALGIGVGTLVGLLVRRTVPAMVTAGLAVLATQMLFAGVLRDLLWPVETVLSKEQLATGLPSPGIQIIEDGMLTASGERILWSTCYGPTGVGDTPEGCMTKLGGVQHFTDVHPESHFWPLQLIESGLLLVLVAITVTVAFRVLGKRYGSGA